MFFGLDVHKQFIQICGLDEKGEVVQQRKIKATPDDIKKFASELDCTDQIVLETTFHSWAICSLLAKSGCKVLVANAIQVKAIAHARVKTDKIDARILAQLLRSGFIPEVQMPDAETWELRQLVSHRRFLVKERTAAKNGVHAVLSRRLVEYGDKYLFSAPGRQWLKSLELNDTERFILENTLAMLDDLERRVEAVEQRIREGAMRKREAQLLITIPGVHVTVAMGLLSAIGDIKRFASPKQLAAYFGLVPSVSQSGDKCFHGSITKTGRSTARWLAIEAANGLARTEGPLAAAFHRIKRKKGHNVALTALARKLVVMVWHMLTEQQPYRYAPVARTRQKLRLVCPKVADPRRAGVPMTLDAALLAGC